MIQYKIWTEKYNDLVQKKMTPLNYEREKVAHQYCYTVVPSKKEKEEVLLALAHTMSDIIQEIVLTCFAKSYLKKCKELKNKERKEIEELFIHTNYLSGDQGTSYISYYVIYTPILKELEMNQQLNIDGWIHFRTAKYKLLLEDIMEQTIYDYEMQKDYIHFINFLLETKSMQECKEEELHLVVNKEGVMSLLDKEGKDITEECIRMYCDDAEEGFSKKEDQILHILINVSPKKLVIHEKLEYFNQHFLETLKALFREQVSFPLKDIDRH